MSNRDPHWHRRPSMVSSVLTAAFITAFGAMFGVIAFVAVTQ